jgi:hypothetical protein
VNKRIREGSAICQSALSDWWGARKGGGLWARMSGSSNVRVRVARQRGQMLDANWLKAGGARCSMLTG